MTSEIYGAVEALRMGLVDQVYNEDEFWQRVSSLAERIASHPPNAISAAKRLVNAADEIDLRSGCMLEREIATHINSMQISLP
jgi:enoyl-CoA hydratase